MNIRSVQANRRPSWPADSQRYPSHDTWAESEDGLVHLIGGECAQCGARSFPRRTICSTCHGSNVEPLPLSRFGTLYSFTTVHTAVPGFAAPYTIGYADLPEGVRVFAQIRDPSGRAKLGAPVEVAIDVIRTLPDGRPVISYVFALEVAP